MDCEKVRDRFSSLWEKELTPSEERVVREHLSSCPGCRREWQEFEKTMQWLHSVGEVEVPDGFLPELHEKMEERKGAIPDEKSRRRWFDLPLSLKLPSQAVAMVAIVFLVLYLTKMMPMEVYRPKETKQTSFPHSVEKKSKPLLSQREAEKERRVYETTSKAPRAKDVGESKAPAPAEEKLEAYTPQAEAEAKKAEALSSKTEILPYQRMGGRERAEKKVLSPEPGKNEKAVVGKERSALASKPPQEIILKISDREKVISQLNELVKQFGGEMVTTEGNMFLASLPTASFSEFEKKLAGLSAFTQAGKVIPKKDGMSLRAAPGVKRREIDEKNKALTKLPVDQESRTIVRIFLVQE
jgi:hypothetical protein